MDSIMDILNSDYPDDDKIKKIREVLKNSESQPIGVDEAIKTLKSRGVIPRSATLNPVLRKIESISKNYGYTAKVVGAEFGITIEQWAVIAPDFIVRD